MAYNYDDQQGPDEYQPPDPNEWLPANQIKTPGMGPNGPADPTVEPVAAPKGGYNYDQLRDNWGGGTPEQLQQYVASHPEFAEGVRASGDKLYLPNGQSIDAIVGAKAGGTARGWTPTGGAAQNPVYAQPQAAPVGSAPGAAPGSAPGGELDSSMRQAIMSLLERSQKPVGDMSTDPRAQQYAGARQRASQRERAALAERAAFQGLNSGGQGSGALDTGVAGIAESEGQDIAGQQAGLVGEEMQSRRQDLMNALQVANAVGARDQSAAIQRELANLDNQYRYAALNQQGNQFNQSLNQRASEFDDTYGLNKAQLEAGLNRNAVLDALLGL